MTRGTNLRTDYPVRNDYYSIYGKQLDLIFPTGKPCLSSFVTRSNPLFKNRDEEHRQ